MNGSSKPTFLLSRFIAAATYWRWFRPFGHLMQEIGAPILFVGIDDQLVWYR